MTRGGSFATVVLFVSPFRSRLRDHTVVQVFVNRRGQL